MKLVFHRKMYLDDEIDNADAIIKSIEESIPVFDLKLICVSNNENHVLEIVSLSEIFRKKYENRKIVVIGMAYGRKNSLKIIQKIFENYIVLGRDLGSMKKNFLENK